MSRSVFIFVVGILPVLELLSQTSRTRSFGQEILERRYSLVEEPDIGTYVGNVITDSDLRSLYSPEVLDMLQLRFLRQSHSSVFLLDGSTGVVRTANRIDRETICPGFDSCVLRVDVAIQPIQFFRIIRLFISIEDINDNSPRFTDDEVTLDVLETVAIGTGLALPVAFDPDSRPFSVQGYELLRPVDSMDLRQLRRGNESVELRLVIIRPLDRESVARYHVTVRATDGGHPPRYGSLKVIVNVIDVNDNSPVFDAESYRATIVENSPLLAPVVKVHAVDGDAGLNGHVVYEMTSLTATSYGHLFGIENATGQIYVNGRIDFEEREVFDLVVVARDLGPDSVPRTVPVVVQVLDENDNAPEISIDTLSSLPGRAEVVECGPVGMFVAHVTVVDHDTGSENGRFNCSLDDPHFRLTKVYETEFHILTAVVLDREQQAYFQLSIVCRDFGGEEAQESVAQLSVGVTDVNDHDPVFQRSSYYGDLIENNYVGAIIFHVNASDRDEGLNAELRFSVEGEGANAFQVDQSSGAVKALVSFDRELVQQVRFRIVVRDSGSPSRSASASGFVSIVDVNDERPQFIREAYYFRIEENEPKGRSVGTVKAEDEDSGLYGQLTYGLMSSPTSEMFSIDPGTGQIATDQPLDRETHYVHNLVVMATDTATPSLTGTCAVVIQVADSNDNRPEFDSTLRTNNTFHVSTHAPRGHMVTRVVARDADAGSNATISYEISSESGRDELFSIDSDLGVVYVTESLLTMDGEFRELKIIAKDGGNPPLASLVFIYVAINGSVMMMSSSVVPGLSQSASIIVRYNLAIVLVLSVISGLITICLITAIVFIRRQDKKQKDTCNCRSQEDEEEEGEDEEEARKTMTSNGRHRIAPPGEKRMQHLGQYDTIAASSAKVCWQLGQLR